MMKRNLVVVALAALAVSCFLFCGTDIAVAASMGTHALTAHGVDPFTGMSLAFGLVTSKKLRDLKAQKTDLMKQASEALPAEGEPSAEQYSAFADLKSKIEGVNKQIAAEEFLADQQSGVEIPAGSRIVVTDQRDADPKRGFNALGEFAKAVHAASRPGVAPDDRLLIGAAAPSTFGSESVGADGGFAIPPAFSTAIFTHSLTEDSLVPYTDNTEIDANIMTFPKDETTPWGTDGVRAYWQNEATAGTPTKPKLSSTTMQLKKLMALVPLTDELLADTSALTSYLPSKIGDSIRWKVSEAILFGLGNGVPQGALQGNAAVVVAKESGQATLTLVPLNLAKMIARLPMGASYSRAIWLINNDVLPALFTLTLGNYPIYIPSSEGMKGAPYGLLLGRPIIISQHAKSFSSQGDVNLLDLGYYRTITKAGGMQTATSMHLYFDADLTAFRTTFRIDGQPKIVNPIAPANGSNNLSPFVTLAAR